MENAEHLDPVRAHQKAMHTLLTEFDRVCRALEIPYILFAGTMLGAVRHQGFIPWDDDLDVLMLRPDYERFLRQAPETLDNGRFYLQKEFSEHWPMFFSKLRLNNTTCLERFHPRDAQMHQGVYMDIFPCDSAADSAVGRRVQFLASKVVIAKCLYRRGYDSDCWEKSLFMWLCRLVPMKPMLWLSRRGRADSALVHSFFGGARQYRKNIYPRAYLQERTMAPFEGGSFPIPVQSDEFLHLLYGDYRRLPAPEQRLLKKHAILVDLEHSYEMYEHYRDHLTFRVHTRSIR